MTHLKKFTGKLIFSLLIVTIFLNGSTSYGQSASFSPEDLAKQMEQLKLGMEGPGNSPVLQKRYSRLSDLMSKCSPINQMIKTFGIADPLVPNSNICINGSLAAADAHFNRTLASSTGTGVGTGVVGNCTLSGSGTAVSYDEYAFNITGCAVFPTVVTAHLCGPGGCTAPAAVDTVLTLYRAVAAGDPLTANGGLPAVFNPASACTNARAQNDDSGGTPTSTGGSTCNQLNTADCLAQCPVSTSLSEFKRSIGSGRFHIVIGGFGNGTVGNYNLYVDAPAAGCSVALTTTASGGTISGRVATTNGTGISKAVLTLMGGDLGTPISTLTNGLGYYSIPEVPVGQSYVLSVSSKRYAFSDPTRVIALTDSTDNEDFIAAP